MTQCASAYLSFQPGDLSLGESAGADSGLGGFSALTNSLLYFSTSAGVSLPLSLEPRRSDFTNSARCLPQKKKKSLLMFPELPAASTSVNLSFTECVIAYFSVSDTDDFAHSFSFCVEFRMTKQLSQSLGNFISP